MRCRGESIKNVPVSWNSKVRLRLNSEGTWMHVRKNKFGWKRRSQSVFSKHSSLSILMNHFRLKKLDDVLERKLRNMHNWDRDTHTVILWLRKNQHLFKMPILEPPAILVNVPNKHFVDTVESCFNSAQLRVSSLFTVGIKSIIHVL